MNNNRGIFWGLFLIVIGLLFGLKNFGIIDFHWSNVFRLWPFVLIYWGVTLLPVKQQVKMLLTFLTIIGFFLALILLPPKDLWSHRIHFNKHNVVIDDDDFYEEQDTINDDNHFHIVQKMDDGIKRGEMTADFGAGAFKLKNTSSQLFVFDAKQRHGKFITNTEIEDSTAHVRIKQKKVSVSSNEELDAIANLSLNPNVVWDLSLNAGAADLDLHLLPFRIEKLDIDAGATDIFVEIGNRQDTVSIDLDAGVSNIEIVIPREMSGEIHTSMVLASRDFIGFDKYKKGVYRTPDFDSNPKKVFINIDAAAAAITVRRKKGDKV